MGGGCRLTTAIGGKREDCRAIRGNQARASHKPVHHDSAGVAAHHALAQCHRRDHHDAQRLAHLQRFPLFAFHFPNGITLGGWLAGALQWHFAAMWLLVANGLFYPP